MINVGKADAIFVELCDLVGNRVSLLVDGGKQTDLPLVKAYYDLYHAQNPLVVVSTHPDSDHINGLIEFMQVVRPTALIVNNPCEVAERASLVQTSRYHLSGQNHNALIGALDRRQTLLATAQRNRVPSYSAYADASPIFRWGRWQVYVLNPVFSEYVKLWTDVETLKTVYDNGDDETYIQLLLNHSRSILDDGIDTSGMNNSSIMLFIEGYGEKFLLTGDADMKAIYSAARYKDLSNLSFLDVPHHGSRCNMNSAIIEHFRPRWAFVSADGSTKHPRTAVLRKLQQVGSIVCSTHQNKESIYYFSGIGRPGYLPVSTWGSI